MAFCREIVNQLRDAYSKEKEQLRRAKQDLESAKRESDKICRQEPNTRYTKFFKESQFLPDL